MKFDLFHFKKRFFCSPSPAVGLGFCPDHTTLCIRLIFPLRNIFTDKAIVNGIPQKS